MKTFGKIFFALLLLIPVFSIGQQKTRQPNILLILADDLGYHDVSYYNTPDIRTPNIDQLCKQGMRFDNFYANSPVCSPSRASIMTGRYPEMVGVPGLIRNQLPDNFGYMTPGIQLLPALLKKANYNTAIVGKWNLGLENPNLPNQKGFDHFHGWLDDMMEDYWKHTRNGINFLRENDKPITPEGHATDLFTQWAIEYLNTQKNSATPFFMYLAYTAPHAPIQPTAEFLAKVKAREPNISDKRANLIVLIEQMDDGIGKVIKTLKANGTYDNTIIIFLSDNGGQLDLGANNGNIREGKGTMYEGGIKIPACITWPGHITPGTQSSERLLHMDIYPTLAEIAGVPIDHKIDGVSFASILKNSTAKLAPRPVFFIRREGGGYGAKISNAIINGDLKLLQNTPTSPFELYDLANDPLEQHDLVKTENEKRVVLHRLLMKQVQKGGSVSWQRPEEN
jgi:arylsulfatase A-like enzyme